MKAILRRFFTATLALGLLALPIPAAAQLSGLLGVSNSVGGGGGSFTPTLASWAIALQRTGLVHDGSNHVTSWTNAGSIGGSFTTSGAGSIDWLSNAVNGLPGAQFNTGQVLDKASVSLGGGSGEMTIIVIFKKPASGSQAFLFNHAWTSTTGSSAAIVGSTAGLPGEVRADNLWATGAGYNSSVSPEITTTGVFGSASSYHVLRIDMGSGGINLVRLDGVNYTSFVAYNQGNVPPKTATLTIAATGVNMVQTDFYLGMDVDISVSGEADKVEGMLLWDAGITWSCTGNNPYCAARP